MKKRLAIDKKSANNKGVLKMEDFLKQRSLTVNNQTKGKNYVIK